LADPCGTFLDICANVGTTTLAALASGTFARVEAFEPEAENVALLRLAVELNGLRERVGVHPFGLSDRDGEETLLINPTNRGDHRIGGGDGPRVPLRSLDSLAADGDLDLGAVTLAWLDVQGHEAAVLDGAACLAEHRIPCVMELMPTALGGDTPAALEAVASRRYDGIIDLGGDDGTIAPSSRLRSIEDRVRMSGRSYTDVLLLP
jgi:FkbM family methyltransferase